MAREKRKVRIGEVISDKMEKTVIVAVRWKQSHPIYGKAMPRLTKFYAHAAKDQCKLGDLVRIEETSPISRLKRWRVVEVVERREIAEVKPEELDREVLAATEAQPLDVDDDQSSEEEAAQ